MKSTVAMALTGVDGHFIACNDNFTTLSGYSRHEVESTSVFNLTLPEEMTQMFNVVSSMLSFSQSTRHFSKTFKFRDREETCFVSMWLIRELDGEPLYFQIMIVPLSDCAGHIGKSIKFAPHVSRLYHFLQEGPAWISLAHLWLIEHTPRIVLSLLELEA